jgi:large repetitive protein
MKAMDFVVRPVMGATRRGVVEGGAAASVIEVAAGEEISLNIRQFELTGYARVGSDLQITLADGRIVTLKGYYEGGAPVARLFISADGYLSEITLVEGSDGVLYAQYGPTEVWGKWSPHEDLIFMDSDAITAPLVATDSGNDNDTVSMLGAGLLLGGGGLGAAGGLAALAAGSVLASGVGGGGSGGGGGGGETPDSGTPAAGGNGNAVRLPTVNEKDPIVVGGGDTPSITISGTADPDSVVEVTIGDVTQQVTPDEDGNWEVVFEGDTFPEDGTYPVVVVVTQPDGSTIDLSGPPVTIDTTPPVLTFTEGTDSVGHIINAEDHSDGIRIAGTSEAGARIEVTVGGVTKTDVTDADGRWEVDFTPTEVPGGEVMRDVLVTATDEYNNSATFTDQLRIDTIPDPIVINSGLIGGNGVVNALEAAGVVSVTGTSTPGNSLTLVYQDGVQTITRTVPVLGNGTWQVDYLPGELRGGEYNVTLTATTSDAAGNIGRASGGFRVDTVHFLQIDPAPLGENNLLNAASVDSGITLRGTTQPGSVVEVRFGNIVRQVTSTDGTWAIPFQSGDFARGEYNATFSVTARDAAGNMNTASRTVAVDTDVAVTLDGGIGNNGLINGAARDLGVTLTGTTDSAQNMVMVQVGGVQRAATVDGFGNWQVRFNAADLPEGQGSLGIMVTATDTAQNSATARSSVQYDTVVQNFAYTSTGVASDGIINGAEASAAQGVFVTGQVEAGSRVVVTLDGVSREANVLGNGTWSVRFDPSMIRSGEYMTTLTAVATDRANNTDVISQPVRVDTRLNLLEIAGPVAGDNMINLEESKSGFEVVGRVEQGSSAAERSTVRVEFYGRSYDATVDDAGNWRAFIPGENIQSGFYTAELIVHARDAAGNAGSLTQVLTIDTDVPTNPIVSSYTRDVTGIRSISIESMQDQVTLTEIASDGTMSVLNNTAFDLGDETLFRFAQNLPDGSHLVVTATDQAGNQSGTFLAFDELSTSVIDLSAPLAAGTRIDAIDLSFAEDSELTLTEAQILALSPDDRSLTIHGGSDDFVTLTGANRTGTETVGGRSYAVYELGEARVVIDETVTII